MGKMCKWCNVFKLVMISQKINHENKKDGNMARIKIYKHFKREIIAKTQMGNNTSLDKILF